MGASTTITIRVTPELKETLGRLTHDTLTHDTRRSRSYIAAEAVEAYVARELAIIDDLQRGLDDMKVGRVTPHGEVMAEARRIVNEARQNKKARS